MNKENKVTLTQKRGRGGNLPKRAIQWIYWNARLYKVPLLQKGYRSVFKKYGIRDPIIVYQMGKVGSSSIHEGLVALHLDVPLYHCHLLNHLDQVEASFVKNSFDHTATLKQLQNSRELKKLIESGRWKRWTLISLVRAPVPRNVSAFFELVTDAPDFYERYERQEIALADLVPTFLKDFGHNAPKSWFDSQVKDVFQIDVFASEFPREKGYKIYEGENVRLLVMRLENLQDCATVAIKEFLGIPDFRLLKRKTAMQRGYSEIYQAFNEKVKLPHEYFDEMNSTKYARHFYSEEELAASTKPWRE